MKKLTTFLLAILMVISLFSCSKQNSETSGSTTIASIETTNQTQSTAAQETTTTQTTAQTTTSAQTTALQTELINFDFSSYDSIINSYKIMVELSFNYPYEQIDSMFGVLSENDKFKFNAIHISILDCLIHTKYEYNDFPAGAFGYTLQDLNGNGNNELILLLEDGTILAIFSMYEGKPNLLGDFSSFYKCKINSDGKLCIKLNEFSIYSVDLIMEIPQNGGELILLEIFGRDKISNENDEFLYFTFIDNEQIDITEEEFYTFYNRYFNDNVEKFNLNFTKLFTKYNIVTAKNVANVRSNPELKSGNILAQMKLGDYAWLISDTKISADGYDWYMILYNHEIAYVADINFVVSERTN